MVTPVPPWPTDTVPVEVKFFEESVNTTLEAVRSEKLMVPDEEIPVAKDKAPELMTSPLIVLVAVGAVMAPVVVKVPPT